MHVQHYGVGEGLSHRDVRSIHQDRRGFIWLGTRGGLNRFDGYQFKWFTEEKNGLRNNDIDRILEDDEGLMWLIARQPYYPNSISSIDLFNPVTEEALPFEKKFGQGLPFHISDISSFANADDGRIAFITKQNKLVVYSAKKGFEISGVEVPALIARRFSGHNTLWCDSHTYRPYQQNLIELSLSGKVLREYVKKNHPRLFFIGGVDPSDNLWSLDMKREEKREVAISKIDARGNESFIPLGQDKLPADVANPNIPIMNFWTNPGDTSCWLLGRNFFFISHPNSGWYQELSSNYPWLLNSNTLFFGRDNKVWIGTQFGLFNIELKPNLFHRIAFQKTAAEASGFRGITKDRFNNFWAGSDFGPGWMCHFKLGERGQYQAEIFQAEKGDWGLGEKYPLLTDSRGFIWTYSNHENTFIKHDPLTGKAIRIRLPYQGTNVWSLFEDRRRRIWFGNDEGDIGYIDEDLSILTLPELEDGSETRGQIYHFLERENNQAFVATQTGLFLLNLETLTLQPYPAKGLPFLQKAIFHIHQDSDGSLWLATQGRGLIHWMPGSQKHERFTQADGLANNTIYAIYEGNKQDLWMSTDYGITQFHKVTHQVRNFLEQDGLTHNEFNRISHFQDEDGTIYFGSLNGITAFHPDNLTRSIPPQHIPLVLTRLQKLDRRQNKWVDNTSVLLKSNTITLKPNDNSFLLEFALLSFSNTGHIQYAYRIKGVDLTWIYQKENFIRFNRLPYGEHTLEIKGQAANGQWSSQELAIKLVVLKPFYLQMWFLLALIGGLFSGIHLFIQGRVRRNTLRQAELEKIVTERTATISRQAEAIRALENFKSRFFANVSHELRTPLTLILGPVNSLLKKQKEDKEATTLLRYIQHNGQQLQKLINEILDLSKLESGKMEVEEESMDFHQYLNEQAAHFASIALYNNIHMEYAFGAGHPLTILLDKGKFEKILHNLLSNALKFTPPEGKITLALEDVGDHLLLKVSDTGEGIHPDDLPFLFDRFYQSKQRGLQREAGTGIGLSLVKELAEVLKGKVWAKSEYGKGCTFYFQFPKNLTSVEETGYREQRGYSGSETEHQLATVSRERPTDCELISSPHPTAKKSNILIVEDNPDLRAYLQFLLSDYELTSTENGQTALDFLLSPDNKKPDLIISDLMMPVMDGFELLEKLKASDHWRHLPVIMLTARANMRTKLKALRIGVDDYLVKPFQEEELMARIDNLVHNHQVRIRHSIANGKGEEKSREPERPAMSLVDAEWLQEVEAIYSRYLSDSILNLDFVAGKLHISERQFRRRIKQLTGLSPNQYLQEMRLQLAREYLTSGRYATVKEVCFAVGFNDTRYFSSLFSKHFGRNPSDLR